MIKITILLKATLASLLLSTTSLAQEAQNYSPYVKNYPQKVLFGDTHLHTSLSTDAFGFGVRLDDEAAYRFARGEQVTATMGLQVRLEQPLDFLVIADHVESYGSILKLYEGNSEFLADPRLKRWHKMLNGSAEEAFTVVMEWAGGLKDGSQPEMMLDAKHIRNSWEKHIANADKYNEPGVFTALQGYEWSGTPENRNLHRVVIYKDGADRVGQILPHGSDKSSDVEKLWEFMAAYEQATGGDVLAVPHNANVSDGKMFDVETFSNKPFSKTYAETRAKWEPLYEVTQIKGDSEAHPLLSPNDEFADYETWEFSIPGNPLTVERLKGEYARSGLKRGLELDEKLGANPYKFGLIGSTDAHTALSTTREENFWGKHSGSEPNGQRYSHTLLKLEQLIVPGWKQAASGFAVVWATENTREAIFEAMERKETYATTGSRIKVRFFGGWAFSAPDTAVRFPAEVGYQKGVPMGGDLSTAPKGKSPSFLLSALKDPNSGNLDRIQIVKGWLNAQGEAQEKVYDVVWSGDRKPDAKGKLPPVGNTVDVVNTSWKNTIGASKLVAVWQDPDFDPAQRAFYYARVIEIPTPRWTAYDAKKFPGEAGAKMPEDVPMITQERAYTSPIWYTPG